MYIYIYIHSLWKENAFVYSIHVYNCKYMYNSPSHPETYVAMECINVFLRANMWQHFFGLHEKSCCLFSGRYVLVCVCSCKCMLFFVYFSLCLMPIQTDWISKRDHKECELPLSRLSDLGTPTESWAASCLAVAMTKLLADNKRRLLSLNACGWSSCYSASIDKNYTHKCRYTILFSSLVSWKNHKMSCLKYHSNNNISIISSNWPKLRLEVWSKQTPKPSCLW